MRLDVLNGLVITLTFFFNLIIMHTVKSITGDVVHKKFLAPILLTALITLNTAKAQTLFSSSLSFHLAATQAATITLDAEVSVVHYRSWLGYEAGITFSLQHIEPYVALRFALYKPGQGVSLGFGYAYFFTSNWSYSRIFIPIEWTIPVSDSTSAYFKLTPGLLFGDTWIGLDLPIRFGLSFYL
jgi:hypothetical protein